MGVDSRSGRWRRSTRDKKHLDRRPGYHTRRHSRPRADARPAERLRLVVVGWEADFNVICALRVYQVQRTYSSIFLLADQAAQFVNDSWRR